MQSRQHEARGRPGRSAGFSLIELMVAVAVVGILAGIAYPSYVEYITRSRIIQATTSLSDYRVKMEQFFQDNRTYAAAGVCGVPAPPLGANDHFQLVCVAADANGYTAQAQGVGGMLGANYQIVVNNAAGVARTTVAAYPGWSLPVPNNCWAIRKNGSCS